MCHNDDYIAWWKFAIIQVQATIFLKDFFEKVNFEKSQHTDEVGGI